MPDFEINVHFNASMFDLTPPVEAELLGQVDQFKDPRQNNLTSFVFCDSRWGSDSSGEKTTIFSGLQNAVASCSSISWMG
jgi:hypothetical protein